jgi:integrase
MSRKKVIAYRRVDGKTIKGRRVYYVGVWNETTGQYDRRATEYTSKADAEAAGWEWYREGLPGRGAGPLVDLLDGFWDDDGDYASRAKLDADGESMSPEYLSACRLAIKNHVVPYLDAAGLLRVQADRVTPSILNGIKTHVNAKGLGPSAINTALKAVMVPISDYWTGQGRPERSPTRLVKLLPVRKISRDLLTLAEAAAFFAHPLLSRRDRLLSQIAAFAGLRVSEICGLKIGDLAPVKIGEHRFYTLAVERQSTGRNPKGGRGTVAIPAALGDEIIAFYDAESWRTGYIFDGRKRGEPLKRKQAEGGYNDAICAALKITDYERKERKLTFHAWRHWYVTYVKSAAGVAAAQRLARHKSEDMTALYDDPTMDIHAADARTVGGIYDRVGDLISRESSQAETRDHKKA